MLWMTHSSTAWNKNFVHWEEIDVCIISSEPVNKVLYIHSVKTQECKISCGTTVWILQGLKRTAQLVGFPRARSQAIGILFPFFLALWSVYYFCMYCLYLHCIHVKDLLHFYCPVLQMCRFYGITCVTYSDVDSCKSQAFTNFYDM